MVARGRSYTATETSPAKKEAFLLRPVDFRFLGGGVGVSEYRFGVDLICGICRSPSPPLFQVRWWLQHYLSPAVVNSLHLRRGGRRGERDHFVAFSGELGIRVGIFLPCSRVPYG